MHAVDLRQQANQWQGGLTLLEVGAQRLAGRRLVSQHVQEVVDNLEADSQIAAKTGKRLLDPGIGGCVVSPQAAAAGTQFGRLGLDNVEIFRFREAVVAAAADLTQLPLAHDVRRLANRLAGVRRTQRARQIEGMSEQVVTQEHAGFIAPTGVYRVEMPAHAGLIEHIVMDQRGRMDHFHDGCQHQVFVLDRTGRLGRQQHQGGPQTFAPEAEAVLRQFVNVGDVASQLVAQDFLDLGKLLHNRIVKALEEALTATAGNVDQSAHSCPQNAAMRICSLAVGSAKMRHLSHAACLARASSCNQLPIRPEPTKGWARRRILVLIVPPKRLPCLRKANRPPHAVLTDPGEVRNGQCWNL